MVEFGFRGIHLVSPSKFLAIKKPPGLKPGANLKLGGDGGGSNSTEPTISRLGSKTSGLDGDIPY
jgi:hypothetical protein